MVRSQPALNELPTGTTRMSDDAASLPSAPGSDERVRPTSRLSRLLSRPELGAVAGTLLVIAFFAVTAGNSGLFSAKGIVNFLEVSAQLGIVASAVALLMIAGEFDLSVGSMIAFSGILIAIPATQYGWPLWAAILLAFARRAGRRPQRLHRRQDRAAVIHRHPRRAVRAARTDTRHHPHDHRPHAGLRRPRTAQ